MARPADGPSIRDSESCAVWTGSNGGVQEGAALRITSSNGVTRALTVTKNIIFFAVWNFNFHTWDTSAPGGKVLTKIGDASLPDELYPNQVVAPYPWHFCARVIGDQLSFKVWLNGEPTPKWGDGTHGGSVTVPADYVYPGYAGWYIGHLSPGGSTDFTGLTTSKFEDS